MSLPHLGDGLGFGQGTYDSFLVVFAFRDMVSDHDHHLAGREDPVEIQVVIRDEGTGFGLARHNNADSETSFEAFKASSNSIHISRRPDPAVMPELGTSNQRGGYEGSVQRRQGPGRLAAQRREGAMSLPTMDHGHGSWIRARGNNSRARCPAK